MKKSDVKLILIICFIIFGCIFTSFFVIAKLKNDTNIVLENNKIDDNKFNIEEIDDNNSNPLKEEVTNSNINDQAKRDDGSNKVINESNDKKSDNENIKKEENTKINESKKDNVISNDKKIEINENVSEVVNPLVNENNGLRERIKDKYGVSISYKDEIDNNYYNSYVNPVKLYDDSVINENLKAIDKALSKYPDGFFKEIKNKWKQLTIDLVVKINDSAAGLTDNRNANTVVILISTGGYLFENTFHHEIMHYIDCYLAQLVGSDYLESTMNGLNPIGFSYGNQSNQYVYYFDSPAYFVSSYSKTNYKEDRAEIFADMMFRTLKKDYYSIGNPINEKAKLIANQLEKYFDTVSSSKKAHFGRLIAW